MRKGLERKLPFYCHFWLLFLNVEIQELMKIDGFIHTVGVWILMKIISWSRAVTGCID